MDVSRSAADRLGYGLQRDRTTHIGPRSAWIPLRASSAPTGVTSVRLGWRLATQRATEKFFGTYNVARLGIVNVGTSADFDTSGAPQRQRARRDQRGGASLSQGYGHGGGVGPASFLGKGITETLRTASFID